MAKKMKTYYLTEAEKKARYAEGKLTKEAIEGPWATVYYGNKVDQVYRTKAEAKKANK